MQILNRLVGALLLLTAAIVGIYFVVDQLEVLPFLWGELDYLMALALVLGLIFASMRKRSLESAGLDRIVTRRYFEAKPAVLRLPAHCDALLLELVRQPNRCRPSGHRP